MTPGDGVSADFLSGGDALAAQLLAELEPLIFREAADERERTEAFRLRYRAVLELGLAPAAHFPDGLEHDDFDDAAVQILGWDGTRAVATCRLVLPAPHRRLPMQTEFGIELDDDQGTVEWGRVVVDPDYRGDGHSVFLGLAARGWLSLRARAYARAIGATPRRLVSLLDALGFAVSVLGAPRDYWGEPRYPILCEAAPTIPRLQRHVDSVNERSIRSR